MFFGESRAGLSNDMYILNVSSLHWTKASQKGRMPIPRQAMGMAALNGKVYMFGGTDASGNEMPSNKSVITDIT